MSVVDIIEELLFVSKEGTYRGYRKCIVAGFVSEDLFCQECEGVLREPCVVGGSNLCTTCSGENSRLCNSKLTEVVNHLKCKCPFNTRECRWLGELCDVIGHIGMCGYMRLECPLGCQSILLREDITEHVESVCLLNQVDCPFSSVGCRVTELCRGNVWCHMESSVMTHQSLLLSAIVGMRETNLNNRELLFSHGRTIKQHDETVKQSILQHEQTISVNIHSIGQHSNSIINLRETMFSNRDSLMRYGQSLEELSKKFECQNETIEQLSLTIGTQNETVKQQNETIKRQNNKIERQNETMEQLSQTIATHNEMAKQQNEMVKQQNETVKQQNETIKQQNNKIELQNETIDQLSQAVAIQNEMIATQIETVKQQNNKIENQDAIILKCNLKLSNLSYRCDFIRNAFSNKFTEHMEWRIEQFSRVGSLLRHVGPKSRIHDITLRGVIAYNEKTNKLQISVERNEFAIYSDPPISLVYWKIEIVNNNNNNSSRDNWVREDQSGNKTPLQCGESRFLAEINREDLANLVRKDVLTLKFSFIFT